VYITNVKTINNLKTSTKVKINQKMFNKFKSSLFFAISLLLIGMISLYSGAVIAKWLFMQISAQATIVLRLAIGAIILCLCIHPFKGVKLTITNIKPLFLYGIMLGVMNFLFYMSLQTLPIGIAITLEFTGPLAVALISARKKIDFVWVILAIIGIYLLMPNDQNHSLDTVGVIYALGAAFAWAMYILFGHKAGASFGMRAAPLGTIIAAFTVFPLGIGNLISHLETLLTLKVFLGAIAMALMTSAIPYGIEVYAFTKMPARTFSILMSLEPVMGALIGLVLLGEQLLFMQWLAVSAIMIASCGATISIRKA